MARSIKLKVWIWIPPILFFVLVSCSKPKKAKSDKAKSDWYNFMEEKELGSLGNYKIKIFKEQIVFHPSHGYLESPLQYPRNFKVFNFNGIYRIDQNSKSYYFRFGWVIHYRDQTIFKFVEWLRGAPKVSGRFENYEIHAVQIPFVQYGNVSICTIGDSQTWWHEASKLRKYINEIDSDFLFVGSNTDIYGYPHDGEGGNSTQMVLSRISRIPKADFYTLLIGTNDWNKNFDDAYENTNAIVNYLLNNYDDAQVLYITPLPTINKPRDEFNLQLSEKLIANFAGEERVQLIDIGGLMRENQNWFTAYLGNDGLHQNDDGVRFMAAKIAEHINNN